MDWNHDYTFEIIIMIVAIIVLIFLTRLIFSIPSIVRNLEMQTKLLKKMAENKEFLKMKLKAKILMLIFLTTKKIADLCEIVKINICETRFYLRYSC